MRPPPWLPEPDPLTAARQRLTRRRRIRADLKARRDAGLRRRHARKDNPRPDGQAGGSNTPTEGSIP